MTLRPAGAVPPAAARGDRRESRSVGGDSEPLGKLRRDAAGLLRRLRFERPRLDDGPRDPRPGRIVREEPRDDRTARGLAHDRDLLRFSAEGGDLAVHPGESRCCILQSEVPGSVLENGESLGSQAVVDRHEDDPGACEAGAVIQRDRCGASFERATVDPDDDRGAVGVLRRPDVGGEDVVAGNLDRAQQLAGGTGVRKLRRGRPERRGIPDAVP